MSSLISTNYLLSTNSKSVKVTNCILKKNIDYNYYHDKIAKINDLYLYYKNNSDISAINKIVYN